MDFVKFYIVQIVKNAASRIRLIDKEKEKLLSRLVARIENSQELFPDLKMMERVVELEETASKLISIYRRLNKSHIDLEKISYQFASDRDAIQSILRRFLQGNFRNGIIKRKRPKIVFDDTTFTIYELKEPEEIEVDEKSHEEELKPKVDLMEFLKLDDEKIISVQPESVSEKIEVSENDFKIPNKVNDDELIDEKLEIENGIAKKSLKKSAEEKETQKVEKDLVLPLEFEWNNSTKSEQLTSQSEDLSSREEVESDLSEKSSDDELREKIDFQSSEEEQIKESEIEKPQSIDDNNIEETHQEGEIVEKTLSEGEIVGKTEVQEKVDAIEDAQSSEQLIKSLSQENDNLYLDFEKLVLDNIIEVDEFLNKSLNEPVENEQTLKLIQKAYKSFELAQELNFDLISELIKVYWLSLVAIRDNKLKPTKTNSELIRSTLIILVSLLKQRDVDLEPFIQKHNQLKEKLKLLDYEV